MNSFLSRVPQPSVVRSLFVRLGLCVVVAGFVPLMAHASDTTSIALTVTVGATAGVGGTVSSSSAIGTVQTLTAVVMDTTASAVVTLPGTVVFCDDDALQGHIAAVGVCGVSAQLGTAQITSTGTAFLSLRLAPGNHILYAKFRGTPGAATPLGPSTSYTSATANYAVSVTATTYPLASVLTDTGSASSGYALTDTLVSVAAGAAPTGSVNFVDTTTATNVGTGTLGATSGFSFSPPAAYLPNFGNRESGADAIAAGDFNDDGYLDLISFSNGSSAQYDEYLGSTTVPGTFIDQGPSSSLSHTAIGALVGDFNNDGYPDVVEVTDNGVYVLMNNGPGGGFSSSIVTLTAATNTRSAAIGDFNGDGNLDIAVGSGGEIPGSNPVAYYSGFQIFTGNGDGTFTAGTAVTYATQTNLTYGMAAADFDGDGYTDLVVGSYASPSLTPYYYENTTSLSPGTVNFAAGTEIGTAPTSDYPYQFDIADLKNDGVLDVIYASNSGVSVAPNTAAAGAVPNFTTAIQSTAYTEDGSHDGFAIGDFNNDGLLDVVAGNSVGNLAFVAGTGNSAALLSATPVYYPIGGGSTFAEGIAAGDFTGSGVSDIATANLSTITPIGVMFPGDLTVATAAPATVSFTGHVDQTVDAAASTNYVSTSTSNPLSLLPLGAMSLTASPENSSALGASVTLTAAISPATIASGPAPTGTVTFYDGTTSLGTYTLTGTENGVATLSGITTLTVGTHSLSAQYTGDSNYTAFTATSPLISTVLTYKVAGTASELVYIVPPASSFSSGGSPGVVTAAEEDAAGNVYASADTLTLTVTATTTPPFTSLVFATGANSTGSSSNGAVTYNVTPTYVNGLATFDLSTLSLDALPIATPATTSYTFTLTSSNGSLTAATANVTVNPASIFVVNLLTDAASSTCNDTSKGAAPIAGCTLRGAITALNLATGDATITFAGGNTSSTPITLTSSLSSISNSTGNHNVTIAGPGPLNLYVSGAGAYTFFRETSTTSGEPLLLTVSGMTLENAYIATGDGPAVYLYTNGVFNNVDFLNNESTTDSGGAIGFKSSAAYNLTLNNCIFSGNQSTGASGSSAYGGAVAYLGASNLVITNSTFYNNSNSGTTTDGGGAIEASNAVHATITGSLFYNNTSSGNGGALYLKVTGTGTLTNDTFYGNSTSDTDGGAMYIGGTITADNLTVVGNAINSAPSGLGGGIYVTGTNALTLNNSVVEANTVTNPDHVNLNVTPVGGSGNLYDTGSTSTYTSLSGLGLLPLTAPAAGALPLPNYGGPTAVLALLPGSILLKAGNGLAGISTDQRGFGRPSSGTNTVDIGAVQSNLNVSFTGEPGDTTVGTTFSPTPAIAVTESGNPLLAAVAFTASLDPGTLNGTTVVSTNAGTGTASFSNLSSSAAEMGTELYISAGSGVSTVGATSTPFNIVGSTSQLAFTTAPATPIAAGGNAGSAVTVQEEDSGGNATGGTATITLTVTYPNATQQVYTQAATGGAAVFNLSAVPLTAAGSYGYSATSGVLTPATATEVVTAGATATQFAVTAVSPANPGVADTVTVTAEDAYGNTVTSYAGTVTLSSTTDAGATFSAPGTLTNGVGSFTAAFDTAGNQTVSAGDGTISGVSGTVVVNDYVWLVNTDGTVDQVTESGTGAGAVGTSGGTSTLGGVAFDNAGGVWSVTSANNALNFVSKSGTGAASYSGGGLNAPVAVAIDGAGEIWVANSGTNSVSEFYNNGSHQSGGTGYGAASLGTAPSGIAIDNTGGVWVTSGTGNSVTHLFGAAAPVTTPTAAAVAGAKLGATP